MAAGTPDPIDVAVGTALKRHRRLVGLSQSDLGGAIGVAFQQVQKYEKGMNRIGTDRLFTIAQVLDVPLAKLFEDVETQAIKAFPNIPEEQQDHELVRLFLAIEDPRQQAFLLTLARLMAEPSALQGNREHH